MYRNPYKKPCKIKILQWIKFHLLFFYNQIQIDNTHRWYINFLTSNARFDSFSIFFNSATSFHHLPTYVPSPLGISVFASSTHTFSFDKLLTSFSQCPVLSLLPAGYHASKPLSYVIDSQLGSWRATGYHNRSSVCDSLLASCVRLQQRQTNAAGCEGNRNDDSRRSRSRGESRIFDRDNAPRRDQVISMFMHCVWKFLRFIFFSILLLSLRLFLLMLV